MNVKEQLLSAAALTSWLSPTPPVGYSNGHECIRPKSAEVKARRKANKLAKKNRKHNKKK